MPHSKRYTRKRRGYRFAGWGQVGQHRDSGSRGGFGKAGLGKHHWIYTLKHDREYFGKHGFKLNRPIPITLNIIDIPPLMKYVENTEDKNQTLNLKNLGYEKLLGKGKLESNLKITIIINKASKKAIEKIEAAGGSLSILENQT